MSASEVLALSGENDIPHVIHPARHLDQTLSGWRRLSEHRIDESVELFNGMAHLRPLTFSAGDQQHRKPVLSVHQIIKKGWELVLGDLRPERSGHPPTAVAYPEQGTSRAVVRGLLALASPRADLALGLEPRVSNGAYNCGACA